MRLTVGLLKRLIAKLPNDAPVCPVFTEIPNDDEPGVEITKLTVDKIDGGKCLCVGVRLFYLNEEGGDA